MLLAECQPLLYGPCLLLSFIKLFKFSQESECGFHSEAARGTALQEGRRGMRVSRYSPEACGGPRGADIPLAPLQEPPAEQRMPEGGCEPMGSPHLSSSRGTEPGQGRALAWSSWGKAADLRKDSRWRNPWRRDSHGRQGPHLGRGGQGLQLLWLSSGRNNLC